MNLFEIKNLSCSYNGGDPVLRIQELNISPGKLVVILGLSGAGKSTLLETLGLMSNTINKGSSLKFSPSVDETYNFDYIWDYSRSDDIFEVRRKHFSFIFQSTNLMPNFSVYENICLTQMLQGKSADESIEKATEMMDLIGLSEIEDAKNAYEISGGQAQRVAFVRAITPEFTVLFGDEPTGNLDEKNSWDLMSILKNKISESKKTAIIVTHNISLAQEFADQIILITKTNQHGTILPKNIFQKSINDDQWVNSASSFKSKEMKNYLKFALGMN